MDILKVVELISTVFVMIGVPLISIPDIRGLYFLLLGQIGWSIFGYFNESYFFTIQSIFLLMFNFIGIYNWRKKRIG